MRVVHVPGTHRLGQRQRQQRIDGAMALEMVREDWLGAGTTMSGLQAARLIAELKRRERTRGEL